MGLVCGVVVGDACGGVCVCTPLFPLREELPTPCSYWCLIRFLLSSVEEVPHHFPPFPYCFLIRFLLTSEGEEVEAPHTISHYFHIDFFQLFPYSFLLDFYQIVKERRLEPPTQFPTISLTPPPHQHPHMCVFKYIQMSLVHHNHYPHHMHHDSSSKYLLIDSLSK